MLIGAAECRIQLSSLSNQLLSSRPSMARTASRIRVAAESITVVLMLSPPAVAQLLKVFKPSEPFLLDNASSSEVLSFSQPGMSQLACVMRCTHLRDCTVAVFNRESRLCRAVRLLQSPGPDGSHVGRQLGDDPGDEVWIAEDFSEMVERLQRPAWNGLAIQTTSPHAIVNESEAVFKNSSSGRNGSVQQAVVSVSGCYRIEARGARGGSAKAIGHSLNKASAGALIAGSFNLSAGTQLSIVVGQSGTDGSGYGGGGGGGGSFVYRFGDGLLYLAAGGSGGSSDPFLSSSGQLGTSGTAPWSSQSPAGGAAGQPGTSNAGASGSYGGPGAGWLGGANSPQRDANCGEGGGGLAEGWVGGRGYNSFDGGFGGGGGSAVGSYAGAGGGGGGYSGGAAARAAGNGGGGGGSFCGGIGCTGLTGGNSGDEGLVSLRLLSSGGCV